MLELPPKFKQALGNGVRTSLYPLVRIYKGYQIDDTIPDDVEAINLSIKETSIKNLNDTYEGYIPLLLNSPSISSKADIINNKYTISSVSLSISNAPYNGKIFSDDIPSLLNAVVQVYYAANGLDTLEDCLLVYTGTIRRYSQSAETLSLTLEDLTEQKLKTKIPATLIEDDNYYKEKDIGKPYPMVYGYVDKSPLVFDKYDSLIIDKPNKEIIGLWDKISSVNYQNPNIQDTGLYGSWLQKKSSLFTYKDGYMPIMEKFPFNFGSREHTINEGEIYNFEADTVNNSAKINLNPSNFLYEKYELQEQEDGGDEYEAVEGDLGIPTRIYRPVKKVSFYAKNHSPSTAFIDDEDDWLDEYKYYPASSNKFYGFSNTEFNEGVSQSITNYTRNIGDDVGYIEADNDNSLATENYNNALNNGEYTWWEPTELNQINVTEDGTWDSKDLNFPLQNQDFNPNWIQDAANNSGLHIHSVNRHDKNAGTFARLQLNQDVPDYPAVTKIFYKIDYFAPSNIDSGTEAEPSAFWQERQLLVRKHNDNNSFDDLIDNRNDWEEYYDNIGGTWTTACEVPNHEHPFDANQTHDRYSNALSTTPDYGGMEFDNIILGFNSTKTTDSINWGLPAIKGYYENVSSCFANLKQFYTIQDVLITEYLKEEYYGSIAGRSGEGFSIDTTDISHVFTNQEIYRYTIITTSEAHNLKANDKFNFYSGENLIGRFTCVEAPTPRTIRVEDEDIVGYYSGKIFLIVTLSKPHNILQDILITELGYRKDIIFPDEIVKDDWIHSFTLKEQEETKNVIENLFKSSIYIPSFDSSGNFKFIYLKQNIEDYEQFEAIDNQDILKYSFGLTKLEDIKNQVNVKYKKDYGSGDFVEETGYGIEDNNGTVKDTLDLVTQELTYNTPYYIGYYGMKDSDAKLEVETKYIRDKETARKLQRRLLMWYANQHLTMKLDLPASYIHLEAGDYIRFDELIGGKLAFGFDYTQEFVKNGQLIYPVFFVTKVAKSLSKVSLELVQVHRGDFGMSDDDLGNYEIPNPYDNDIYFVEGEIDDLEIYFDIEWLSDYERPDLQQETEVDALVITNLQTGINIQIELYDSSHDFIWNGNEIRYGLQDDFSIGENLVNSFILQTDSEYGDNARIQRNSFFSNRIGFDYSLDPNAEDETIRLGFSLIITSDMDGELLETLDFVQNIPPVEQGDTGDLNNDGAINVLDVVILVLLVLDEDDTYVENGDLNNDGGLNILDVVLLVNLILG